MLSIFVTFLFQHSWTEMSSILFYKALIAVRNTRPWHCMFSCICILYIKKETLDIKLAIHPKLHGSNTFTKWNTNISWKWQYKKGKKKQLFVIDTLYFLKWVFKKIHLVALLKSAWFSPDVAIASVFKLWKNIYCKHISPLLHSFNIRIF